jgi:hypothetical protein
LSGPAQRKVFAWACAIVPRKQAILAGKRSPFEGKKNSAVIPRRIRLLLRPRRVECG